jgi:hypothetical protein
LAPILVTESGTMSAARFTHPKKLLLSIVRTVVGMVKDLNVEHPKKISEGADVNVDGKLTLPSSLGTIAHRKLVREL